MPIDYRRYPPNWRTEIRPKVLARDGYKCKNCGISDKESVYVGLILGEKHWFPDHETALRICGPSVRRKGNNIIEYPRKVGVSLQIAHLDHDEENHSVSIDRLASLCQMCHHKYDALEKVRRRKL